MTESDRISFELKPDAPDGRKYSLAVDGVEDPAAQFGYVSMGTPDHPIINEIGSSQIRAILRRMTFASLALKLGGIRLGNEPLGEFSYSLYFETRSHDGKPVTPKVRLTLRRDIHGWTRSYSLRTLDK